MGAFFENLPAPNFPFAFPPLAGYNVTVSNQAQTIKVRSAPPQALRIHASGKRLPNFLVVVTDAWFEFYWTGDVFSPGL